jgi:hypothetical protein
MEEVMFVDLLLAILCASVLVRGMVENPHMKVLLSIAGLSVLIAVFGCCAVLANQDLTGLSADTIYLFQGLCFLLAVYSVVILIVYVLETRPIFTFSTHKARADDE